MLQRVADDELHRVMVFEPPRHGKSELVSRLFPAYYLYRHPERFVGIASYGADLAYTLSRAARENFQRAGGQLSRAASAVKYWLTRAGGGLWAAGVGGPATGKGFHLGIVDDPIKDAKEAASGTIRERIKDWYSSVFATREEPGGAIVVVQTRWHEEDLAGWLLTLEVDEPEHWYIVNLQAIRDVEDEATFPPTCTVHPDWRENGEPLCPERYSLDRLRKLANRIREYFFGALFQQRPRPRDGGMFSGAAEIVTAVPAGATYVRYWDKAGAAPGKGDYTVGALLAHLEGITYVVDVERGQWVAAERNAKIKEVAELDRQAYGQIRTYVEQPPGDGVEATGAIIRLLQGYAVYADPIRGKKEERAEPLASQWQAHNVKVLKAKWNKAFLEELRAFPTGANDDQVDAAAGAYNKLASGQPPEAVDNPFYDDQVEHKESIWGSGW